MRLSHPGVKLRCPVVIIIFLLFVICFFVPPASGKQSNATLAIVKGSVFLRDSAGTQSFVPEAKVKLDGPASFETETDENGNYLIASVPLGTYTFEAVSPGLETRQTLRVEGGEVHVSSN